MYVIRLHSNSSIQHWHKRQLPDGNVELIGIAAPYERYARVDDGEAQAGRRTREKIARGAFNRVINAIFREELNVLGLINHNPRQQIMQTGNRTLSMREVDAGLEVKAILNPRSFLQRAILNDLDNGDITGMSIGFNLNRANRRPPTETPIPREGKGVYVESFDSTTNTQWRILKDVDLQEVSVLTRGNNPAYRDTELKRL